MRPLGCKGVSEGTAGASGRASSPLVSVIIPVRNERKHIESLLESILAQREIDAFEILVADGMSDDGTSEILAPLGNREKRIRIIENRGKIVSTGLNAAIREARGGTIIRMDAHTEYAPDYVARCIETLKSSGADNVGGPWQARGRSYLQSAIALAFHSPFSSGGAGSHQSAHEGPVDSVYLGCWRKETLFRLGLFDEELVRNQDDELNLRLIRSGGKIWQSPVIQSWYYPRASLGALFKQYMQYGYWKVRVIQKHRLPASIRHLVPGGFVALLLILLLVSPFSLSGLVTLCWTVSLYFGANICASLYACRNRENLKYLPVMPIVFGAYHLGYGYGFLRGMINFLLLRKGGDTRFTKITREKA